jgi:hypothetical protein
MDASQYKDYVLVLLFIKYISDKYANRPYQPITVPAGASFQDLAALKGTSDIGDQINKKIIEPLAKANKLSDFPDFNDHAKLGTGKELVARLTDLIAIFENPALDFSKNRADGDDILGDAYEYLMRHFATESGKSKGQFYTPAEVSRVIAQILGSRDAKTSPDTTVYDPTCGSGSLLLKIADAAPTKPRRTKSERGLTTMLSEPPPARRQQQSRLRIKPPVWPARFAFHRTVETPGPQTPLQPPQRCQESPPSPPIGASPSRLPLHTSRPTRHATSAKQATFDPE